MKRSAQLAAHSGLIVLIFLLLPVIASGQSVWLDPTVEGSIALEILKPDLSPRYWWDDVPSGAKPYSSVWFLSLKARISDHAFLLLEIPSSHYDSDATYWNCPGCERTEFKGQSLIGNPFVGIEGTSSVSPFYIQFGLRIPVATDDRRWAMDQGIAADPNRLGTFVHDVFTTRLRAGVRTREESGLAYHLYLGPGVMAPVGSNSDEDTEVYLDYGSQLWFVTEKARLGVGLTGLLLATNDGGGLGESSLHQFGVAANFLSGRARPGAHLFVPLDDDMPEVQFVWGLTLQVGLGN